MTINKTGSGSELTLAPEKLSGGRPFSHFRLFRVGVHLLRGTAGAALGTEANEQTGRYEADERERNHSGDL